MKYFLFMVTLEGINLELCMFSKLKVRLSKFRLENSDKEILDKEISIFKCDKIVGDENSFLLFIKEDENVENQFEYLFDEEYEIIENDLEISYEGRSLVFTLKPMRTITEEEIKEIFLEFLESKRNKGHMLGICGLKPNNKGMYGKNLEIPQYKKMAKDIAQKIIKINNSYNHITHVITSCILGFDTITFFAIEYLKKRNFPNLKNVLVIPYRDISKSTKWNKEDIGRFERMKKLADFIIYLDEDIPEYFVNITPMGKPHPYKINQKDYFIVDNCSMLLTNDNGDYLNNFNYYAKTNGNTIFKLY